ncbi:MAG TPA: PAS domain S-box protein [Sphingomicrobium sp.]|nr:PAS domain S-box protein [Sphingomicrobium sp.]
MSNLLSLSEEQRFRLLVSAVTDYAIYMLDPDGRITTWNPGIERFKGYGRDEIIGEHFSRFFTPEDVAADVPGHALRSAVREGRFEAEGWRLRKDGSRFWVNAVIDPIFGEDGELIGFAKITRDITDKKFAQEELESAREALAQSQKLQALGELTGGIAHDFNNLMTIIGGASDFLLKHSDLPPKKRQRYLEAIADTVERATSLTNHLLAFSRRQALKPVVLDLGIRLDAFVEMIGRMLGSPIRVTLDSQAKPALVEVDATQLETALLNAALNARDAMPDGGELTIGTANCEIDGQASICVTISDTGSGIPEAILKRAFEPFFTTKEVGKGTGLGLSQIHGFAAQAGGRAEIESRLGEGTTVRIYLPATDKPVARPAPEVEAAEVPPDLRVLLVEDNPAVRDFAAELLEDLHCKVTTADGGDEAMRLLRSQQFDLVFSDVVMPSISGLELAQLVKAEQLDIPVLLATGYSSELLGRDAKTFTVVSKPFNATTLAKAISAILNTHRSEGHSEHAAQRGYLFAAARKRRSVAQARPKHP